MKIARAHFSELVCIRARLSAVSIDGQTNLGFSPRLIREGRCAPLPALKDAADGGLDAVGLLNDSTNYSIGLRVEFDTLPGGASGNGYVKMLDFTNLQGIPAGPDAGLYYHSGVLQFYNHPNSSSATVLSGEFHTVVLTRDGGTGSMGIFLDGAQVQTIDDSANNYGVLTTPSTTLWFLTDDIRGNENSDGRVTAIRIWDGALDARDVAALDLTQAVASTVPAG